MKTIFLNKSSRAFLILVCIAFPACNSKKQSALSNASKPLPPFNRAGFLDIIPMSDGSAYAKAFDSRLWYLRGNNAVLVTARAGTSHKLPELSEITAVLDGGAYAISSDENSGLWYLHAEVGEKVTEVSSLANSSTPREISDRAFYALYLSEHKKRKDAEHRIDKP